MAHTHGHHSSHGHHHGDEKNLLWATLLNVLITIAEIVGGILSNSLALLSDAVHNLGDTIAIFLAFIANRISKRNANERKTFGYKRIEILTALLNAVLLIVITVFLFIEAAHRFRNPEPIHGQVMFWVASVGLVANLVAVLLLKKQAHHNLNIRAAYLHLLGDTISSVAVIAGSVLIIFYKIYWIDPLITLLIGIYILKEAYQVVQEAVNILMMATPASIAIGEVVAELEKHAAISNVHHVHSWKLDDQQIHFECHIDLKDDLPMSRADIVRIELEGMLLNRFQIKHTTIQLEYNCCHEKQVIHQ